MTARKGQGHEGGGAGRPAGEALPGLPTRAGIGLSGAPDGDLAPPKSRTHHPAQAGPHLPTDRPTDRETLRGRGREMRAWETKSCPTTGTLHGHASGPGAPFPATPGSRGPAGYRPPSPDPSGLGKKNVSTEAPPTNGPREGRRRGPSHPFRSTPHVLCRSRPREYDSARAGGSHQSGGRRGGAHAGMTTGKQACRPPSLSRPPTPSAHNPGRSSLRG